MYIYREKSGFVTSSTHALSHCTYITLHMSIITQYGESALMMAAMEGHTEVVVELVKAGTNKDLQDKVDKGTIGSH